MWYLSPIQINDKNPLDFSGGRISLREFKQFDQGHKICLQQSWDSSPFLLPSQLNTESEAIFT